MISPFVITTPEALAWAWGMEENRACGCMWGGRPYTLISPCLKHYFRGWTR